MNKEKPQIEKESELDILTKVKREHEIILFNDDVNTFDHVINTLVAYCDHSYEQAEQCAYIVHYSGKFKPWSLKGALNGNSNFYHSYYKKLYEDDYHIYNARRLNTFKDLMKNLLNLKIFAARKSFTLFKYTFLSLRRKKRS